MAPMAWTFTVLQDRGLHMAEPELSVLTRQALSPRMATQDAVHAQGTAWAKTRNAADRQPPCRA